MASPMGYHGAIAHGLGCAQAPADAVAFAKQRLDKLRGKSTAQKEHERTRHSQGIYEEVSTLRSVAPWMRARMISDRQYDFYQRQEERSLLGVIEGWLEG